MNRTDWGWGYGRRPVMSVNWKDAWRYADWLSEQTGEEYRLLTEAEWEYVARAGTRTPHHWGEGELGRMQCRYANGNDDDLGCWDRHGITAPVGTYLPNAFGLYDVAGNVAGVGGRLLEWELRRRADGRPLVV